MHGKPMIVHMLDRLKQSKSLNDIIICTSNESQDDPLVEIAKNEGVQCYRGDGDDVIARLLGAAENFGVDYIVNITADCPFVDPVYIDQIVNVFKQTNADLIRAWDLPHGAFSYGIKTESIKKVINLKDSTDTEVWYQYFSDTGLFDIVDLDIKNTFHKRPGLRMTLDYPEDWQFFEAIFDELYKDGKVFALDEILQLLDNKPEIVELNKHCSAKFFKRYSRQSKIKLKNIQSVQKVLIIGCGSIGQRHIRNLRSLGVTNIIALRSKKGHFQNLPVELNITEVGSWDEAINENPDIAIIANPTSLHLDYILKLLPLVKGIFVEKPLSHSMEGIDKLVEEAAKNKTVLFVGHNLMFHPIVKSIKQFIDANDLGSMLNIQCQFGQWLPDWHPYEDFRELYACKKDLGGGVILTEIHEFDLCIWYFGRPVSVTCLGGTYSNEGLDVEDTARVILDYENFLVQVNLTFWQKHIERSVFISGEDGCLAWNQDGNSLIITNYQNNSEATKDVEMNNDSMFNSQVKDVLTSTSDKSSINLNDSYLSIAIVMAAKKSMKEKRTINMDEINND